MGEEPVVDLVYALTWSDVDYEEFGRIKNLPLSKALEQVERMLKGSYVMCKLIKRR